ncbi:SRPBCC domain-containing protein [Alkalihalobacillus oceani]|uniref:SRPBCC family protein n=1 Tax=Halalkalibacter oceani TaxID=1653776 RepID=UPI002041B7FB|nr:SRPBCC domain-containing protein [Halalkalibacter oceani]MCM3760569.1 SRPBCC domain-containing protein [Halalkalibacter oceani]
MSKSEVPEIRKQATFRASIEKVWATVATQEGIEAWFMPNDFKPELGHTFTIQSPFGPSVCKVLEMEPPNRLAFSWGEEGWKITFLLEEAGNETAFTLIHSGWGAADEIHPGGPGQTNKEIRERMNQGWEAIVQDKLRQVVEA